MLVTHQVNITGLTGEVPESGEMIIVRIHEADPVQVIGQVATPA
ncbi:hypothetical protein [Mesorhizobium sp.]|nr:hypothetical protein [Mesorhizobium sp.]